MVCLKQEGDAEAIWATDEGFALTALRCAGEDCLGGVSLRVMGPHWGERYAGTRPQAEGQSDPYIHGIAPYASWDVKEEKGQIRALLQGEELAKLEGQNFTIRADVAWEGEALRYRLSIASESDSLVGLLMRFPHTSGAYVESDLRQTYHDGEKSLPVTEVGDRVGECRYRIPLNGALQATFHPYFDATASAIKVYDGKQGWRIRYAAPSEENSWTATSQEKEVELAVVSAQVPSKPILTVSTIDIWIEPVVEK